MKFLQLNCKYTDIAAIFATTRHAGSPRVVYRHARHMKPRSLHDLMVRRVISNDRAFKLSRLFEASVWDLGRCARQGERIKRFSAS